ncbi:protein RKD3 [Rosa rugosa]|uniref:protein RKD3 n=1 Tax=Rosa rugosa TaxID=74645 RepID=UPI002B4022C3|nr:protein RKD3 [Rosa rugosa]
MTDSPWAVVPYHDPYDHEVPDVLNFINDTPDPTLDTLFDGGVVPSFPHQYPIPQFDNGIQEFPMSPMWDMGNNYNGGGNNTISVLADHPSQCSGGGGGESGFDQNSGLGFGSNVMPPPVWAPPPIPFSCCGCQVLREIVHFNRNYIMTLEIHGRLGAICHAIQESRANYLYDSSASIEPHYQNFDFCNKNIEEVKQFLTQYCLERKVEGYIMQQDPLQAFYQTLCVGMDGEWDDILSYPDEFIPEDLDTTDDFISPNSERAEEMEQPVDEMTVNMKGKGPRLLRFSLAEQRERAAKMKLNDLRAYFHLTIEEASEQLGFCPTVVKRICRKFGVSRWPARKIKSIERRISSLRPLLNSYSDSTRVHVVAEIKRLEREVSRLVS